MRNSGYLAWLTLALLFSFPCFAQLTVDQKIAEFLYVADSYANQYGPYEWKQQVEGYDLLDLRPWIERIRSTTNDIECAETLVDYVASLDDAHDGVSFPLNFSGNLGFSVDIYEGRVLVDSINRTRLPVAIYPFQIGDELLSVDGVSAADLIRKYRKYSIAANPTSTDRIAVGRLVNRLRPCWVTLRNGCQTDLQEGKSGDVFGHAAKPGEDVSPRLFTRHPNLSNAPYGPNVRAYNQCRIPGEGGFPAGLDCCSKGAAGMDVIRPKLGAPREFRNARQIGRPLTRRSDLLCT